MKNQSENDTFAVKRAANSVGDGTDLPIYYLKGVSMKIITVCGSLRFEQEMKYYAEKLELEGNCVLTIIYPTKRKEEYTEEEINVLNKGHIKRIDISEAVFIVNKDCYIGEAVRKEIDYAKAHGKEIIYLENN